MSNNMYGLITLYDGVTVILCDGIHKNNLSILKRDAIYIIGTLKT